MSNSICNFIPAKNHTGNLKTVHFVYESDFHTLKQPFLRPIYYVHLVTGGTATLRIYDKEYPLAQGTLFFTFPAVPFTIAGSEDFKYLYISFMGASVSPLLSELEITLTSAVYPDFHHLIDFWMSSITRVNEKNANLLSEGVLLCTLSFINNGLSKTEEHRHPENLVEMLVDYIDNHYRDPDLSLKKLAAIFSYTEKYISHLFKSRMSIGFNRYLNNLRIRYAHELIGKRAYSISEIAALCGYSDPLYFSKVFKKRVGYTPSEYMNREERPI
ncbi:MAG: helix-turn-helix transcriptional regulator [Clostridia bacterium]|nr:helix-turn-helix transcriptional regulator [Clostridia bacterium]